MTGRLENKTAIITGGGGGIGRASALRFLEEGAKVMVADINETTGNETVAEAKRRGFADCRFVKVDVSEEKQIEDAFARTAKEFGSLDIVFNNAGLPGAIGHVTEIEVDDWDYTQDMLLRSVFLGIKHAGRMMRAQGRGGAIVNTASIAGLIGGDSRALAYAAAKAGVVQLTRRSGATLAADRIRVNAVAPGYILTPLIHRGNIDKARAAISQAQPWPDAGEPVDIANAALFLASDEARFITGTTVTVDGGATAIGSDRFNAAFGTYELNPQRTTVGRDAGTTGMETVLKPK